MPEDPPAKPKVPVEICWSTDAAGLTEGRLTWIVCEPRIPDQCGKCGEAIRVSAYGIGSRPIELECERGHKWRSVLAELENRIVELGEAREATC